MNMGNSPLAGAPADGAGAGAGADPLDPGLAPLSAELRRSPRPPARAVSRTDPDVPAAAGPIDAGSPATSAVLDADPPAGVGRPARALAVALFQLEWAGMLRAQPGLRWQRC
jgi:hypothetical protein